MQSEYVVAQRSDGDQEAYANGIKNISTLYGIVEGGQEIFIALIEVHPGLDAIKEVEKLLQQIKSIGVLPDGWNNGQRWFEGLKTSLLLVDQRDAVQVE